jgi:NitT/TauT family transport system ATP-binding protein
VFLAERAVMFTRRPARVLADRSIELPAARDAAVRGDARYHQLVERLHDDLLIAESGG